MSANCPVQHANLLKTRQLLGMTLYSSLPYLHCSVECLEGVRGAIPTSLLPHLHYLFMWHNPAVRVSDTVLLFDSQAFVCRPV